MVDNELVGRLERRHADELQRFRRSLMDDANLYSAARPWDISNPMTKLGPLRSLTDRHANLTFTADRAEMAYASENPNLTGHKITLSIAGHHRMMNSRVMLSLDETDAWLYAILGKEWADHSYHAGALTGVSTGLNKRATIYYYLYLSQDGDPITRPDDGNDVPLTLVNPEAFTTS
jgi:hypothetical protein